MRRTLKRLTVGAVESEGAMGIRRETASGYLKQAGIAVREPGRWGRAANPAATKV